MRSDDGTLLVLDAGTGIRRLGVSLEASPRMIRPPLRADILLTHLHMDHIQGLGFFGPLYDPNVEIHIWGPASVARPLRERLNRYLSPPLFPVHLRSLPSQLTLHETPHYRAQLDSRGGVIRHWELSRFDTGPKHGRQPIVLTTGEEPYDGVLATPFDELGLGDLSQASFRLERSGPGVFLFTHTQDGVEIHKRFAFSEDGYDLELTLRVANGSQRPIAPRFSVLFPAAARAAQDFTEQALAVLHEGSVERHPLSGFGKAGFFSGAETLLEFPGEVDWAGVETTYFIAALLPDTPAKASARLIATRPG